MIIFIRIVLIYFIIGCMFGLLVNWLITTIYAEAANRLNRKIKDEAFKKILLVMIFLWPLCLMAVYYTIKEKQKTCSCSDKIIEMILNDDFYEEES